MTQEAADGYRGYSVEGLPAHWHFFDNPGHFIAGDSCRFYRHTHVGPGRKYCVSTVGDYHPAHNAETDAPTEIGFERLYETMVFEYEGDDPYTELAMVPYQTAAHAHDGHLEVCYAWDRKDET